MLKHESERSDIRRGFNYPHLLNCNVIRYLFFVILSYDLTMNCKIVYFDSMANFYHSMTDYIITFVKYFQVFILLLKVTPDCCYFVP